MTTSRKSGISSTTVLLMDKPACCKRSTVFHAVFYYLCVWDGCKSLTLPVTFNVGPTEIIETRP